MRRAVNGLIVMALTACTHASSEPPPPAPTATAPMIDTCPASPHLPADLPPVRTVEALRQHDLAVTTAMKRLARRDTCLQHVINSHIDQPG